MPRYNQPNKKDYPIVYSNKFSENIFGNIILLTGGIILFLIGIILYGIFLNSRVIPLQNLLKKNNIKTIHIPVIVIDKSKFILSLYDDTLFIKKYRAVFGQNHKLKKRKKGDLSTPSGVYKICSVDTSNKYYKFFRINYPNIKDDVDALRKGIISQNEFDQLKYEFYYSDCPKMITELGGNIGIHGVGRLNFIFRNLPFVYNWTDGSIAISNEDIDELYKIIKVGTKVVIK